MELTKEVFDFQIAEKVSIKVQNQTDSEANSYYGYLDDGIDTQFTWRSCLVGSLLGSVVAASNMYLGLKSGWTFSASIFGAILGFGIMKPLSKFLSRFGGAPFGIKENCTIQTAATAAGGLTAGFIAGIPAMFRLGLLPPLQECWTMFFLWTIAAGFYGLFFAIPLRYYFVIQQKLVFPSPTAAAHTIRSLHSSDGEKAKIQTKWIICSFLGAITHKVTGYFIPFIIDMHPLYWIYTTTNIQVLYSITVTWRWKFQITSAFFGAGMMIGLNTALSFFTGNLLAWGIIGPALYYSDTTDVLKGKGPYGFDKAGARVQTWNLWVGIVIMICASFTELAMQYKSIWNGVKGIFYQFYNIAALFTPLRRIEYASYDMKDPVDDNELIPNWMWTSGALCSLILSVIVMSVYFEMNIGAGILAAFLSFIFAFIGCQSSGETDINPTGVVGKASQFCFANIPAPTLQARQLNNIIAGTMASASAAQTVDMVGDLKTGHLLRASPRSQFYAQIIGSIFGVVIAVALFMLFATAYPCLIDMDKASNCQFPAPGVIAWVGVTQALTTDISKTITPSCRIACLIFGLVTVISTILKNTILKPYAKWIPNWNAIGVAFVNAAPYIPLASLIGALFSLVWEKINSKYWNIAVIALASGLIAGEGVGGVFHALLTVSGITEEKYATRFACPRDVGC